MSTSVDMFHSLLRRFSFDESLNVDEKSFLYVAINFQYYIWLKVVLEDYKNLGASYVSQDNGIGTLFNMNEGQYLKMCNMGMKMKDLRDGIAPIIISELKLINNFHSLIESSKTHYYNIDGTFTENDINEFNEMLKETLEKDLI